MCSSAPLCSSHPDLNQHPYIGRTLLRHNLAAGNLARASVCLLVVNLLASSVYILRVRSAGSASSLSLATNTVLLGGRLWIAAVVCLRPSNLLTATSIYKSLRVVYNVVSPHHDRRKDERLTWAAVAAEAERMRLAESGDVRAMTRSVQRVMHHIVRGASEQGHAAVPSSPSAASVYMPG